MGDSLNYVHKSAQGWLWGLLLLIQPTLGAFGALGAPPSDLEVRLAPARQVLMTAKTLKDLKAAEDFYGGILWTDPLFKTKIQDLIQWRLRLNHGAEAWKLHLLAERLGYQWPNLDYSKALSAMMVGVCTLNVPVANSYFRFLARAHIYRFGVRFSKNPKLLDPYEVAARGRRLSYLNWNQLPYLPAIAQRGGYLETRLLRGLGCSSDQGELQDHRERQGLEFVQLKSWWTLKKQISGNDLNGETAVRLRLLWLALNAGSNASSTSPNHPPSEDDAGDLVKELLDTFEFRPKGTMDHQLGVWQGLDHEEKSFLWAQFIATKRVPSPPYKFNSSEASHLVMLAHSAPSAKEAATWYSLLDVRTIPLAQHQEILDQVIQKKSDPDSSLGCLLFNRAQIGFTRGQTTLALTMIRRLLWGGESAGDREVEARAEHLASELITEYQYDQAILGTIQTLLPPSLWIQIFQKIVIDHGLRGQKREFEQIVSLGPKKQGAPNLNFNPVSLEVLGHMAARKISQFERSWTQIVQTQPNQALSLAERMADRSLGLKSHEKLGVSPYFKVLLDSLSTLPQRGRTREVLGELRKIWSFALPANRFNEGVATVQGGVVQAGVVDLNKGVLLLSCDQAWKPPTSLNLKPLLAIPRRIGFDEWEVH